MQMQGGVPPAPAPLPPAAVNPKTVSALRARAKIGDPLALYDLGQLYRQGGGYGSDVPQDYSEALKFFLLAADRGLGEAQDAAWRFFYDGTGTPRDFEQAFFWAGVWNKSGQRAITNEQRDMTRMHLSPEQLAAVEKRIKAWKPATGPTVPV
jgi:hypothetical protein